jgi:cyclic-di-GMP-binding protein
MLDFTPAADRSAAGPFDGATAADAYWQGLPRSDPIAAQKAVVRTLAGLPGRGHPGIDQLQAVLALDQRARTLVDALLVNYVAGDAKPPNLERASWQGAFELCRSFGQVYGQLLRSVRDRQHYRRWRGCMPAVVLRLFQHRQIELLLRPFVDERSSRFPWREVHEAYEYARAQGLLHQPLEVTRCRAGGNAETTLEREYVHVLLQDLSNRAQFSPHEAFWVVQGIPRLAAAVTLLRDGTRDGDEGLVVDLNSDAGVARSTPRLAGARLGVDITPALTAIRDDVASLRDQSDSPNDLAARARSRQLKLLRKVSVAFAPRAPPVARRGERRSAALTVELIVGLAQIVGTLCRKPASVTGAPPSVAPENEPSTLATFGRFTGIRTSGFYVDRNAISLLAADELDTGSPLWRLVDRSDSGCRLQGQIFDSNWVIPGTLIAYREDAAVPWTVAVVRRVEKQADNRVDIGAEYIGKNPRGVRITAASGAINPGSPIGKRPSFAALYLPESTKQPVMPIKTLILPAHDVAPNGRVTLRSTTFVYTMQLKEPIEEQGDFFWSPFDIVDRRPREAPTTGRATSAV